MAKYRWKGTVIDMNKSTRTTIGALDSSKTLGRLGAQQEVAGGDIVYSNKLGIEKFIDAASQRLSGGVTPRGSYKNSDYELAYTYFEKRSGSKVMAKTMAAVILDVCSMSGYTVQEVTTSLSEDDGAATAIRKRATDIMNKIRTPADQHMIVRDTVNVGKVASRLISP